MSDFQDGTWLGHLKTCEIGPFLRLKAAEFFSPKIFPSSAHSHGLIGTGFGLLEEIGCLKVA